LFPCAHSLLAQAAEAEPGVQGGNRACAEVPGSVLAPLPLSHPLMVHQAFLVSKIEFILLLKKIYCNLLRKRYKNTKKRILNHSLLLELPDDLYKNTRALWASAGICIYFLSLTV
jgi:hypothetical protein